MARETFESWLPEEYDSAVLSAVRNASVIERVARSVPMGSDTKKVARSGGVAVGAIAKGASYPESTATNDTVILDAVKIGQAVRIAEEDIDDSFVDLLDIKKADFGTSYGVYLDNATLGTTAASNGGTVPFNSVYRVLSQADAGQGYTANANIIKTAGALTYADLSDVLAKVESGLYAANTVVIAHPSFKASLRTLADTAGRPIFIQGLAGTPDTIFGLEIQWSRGAVTSATASATPAGNPLLIVGNSDFLLLGNRSPLESMFIDPRDGLAALTDEAILKFRARKAFTVGSPNAFAAIEVTAV